MSLIHIQCSSLACEGETDIYVALPARLPKKDEKFKVLLLLHGVGDCASAWHRKTNIERYANEYDIAVVMPGGSNSFYTDMAHGKRYYTFVSSEVLSIVRAYLPISDKREDTFIAGNSMGGYGAMKIALKNPDKFCACAGLSSVADVQSFMDTYTPHYLERIFGSKIVPNSERIKELAVAGETCSVKPRIYMACAFGDYMYKENLALRDYFLQSPYEYFYEEGEGVHDWKFWNEFIPKALAWLLKK